MKDVTENFEPISSQEKELLKLWRNMDPQQKKEFINRLLERQKTPGPSLSNLLAVLRSLTETR